MTNNRLQRVGKYVLATLEYSALATFGMVKTGGSKVKNLLSSLKEPVARLNPAPPISKAMKKISKGGNGNIESVRITLEQKIAVLEERLNAIEKQRMYLPEKAISQKEAIEMEKLGLLKRLVEVNKSLKE